MSGETILERLKALDAKATGGWHVAEEDGWHYVVDEARSVRARCSDPERAIFIALSRTHLGALIDAAEALQEIVQWEEPDGGAISRGKAAIARLTGEWADARIEECEQLIAAISALPYPLSSSQAAPLPEGMVCMDGETQAAMYRALRKSGRVVSPEGSAESRQERTSTAGQQTAVAPGGASPPAPLGEGEKP